MYVERVNFQKTYRDNGCQELQVSGTSVIFVSIIDVTQLIVIIPRPFSPRRKESALNICF